MKKIPDRYLALGIFVLACVLRLAYTLFLRNHYFFYDNPSADVKYYLDWAREIAFVDPIGKKIFFGLPLYPYFLGVLYRLSLGHLEVVRFLQILLGSMNCALIFVIAKHIFQSRKIAVVSGLIMATNFLMIYYDFLMMPVTLIITLTCLVVLALLQRQNFVHWRQWLILGGLIGLTILGDGKFLFFLLGLSGILLIYDRINKKTLMHIVVLWIGASSIVGLCALRNRIVGGDWVAISAQSGLSFYAGNNPEATGTFSNPEYIRPTHEGQDEDQKIIAEAIAGKTLSPKEVSNFWKNKALAFITEHPWDYLKLLMKKTRLFFSDTQYGSDLDLILQWEWKQRFDVNPLPFLMVLGFIGMARSLKRYPDAIFPACAILSQLVMTLIFFMSSRHRATVIPFLLMFEVAAVFFMAEYLRKKNVWKPAVMIILSLAAILVFPTQYLPDHDIAFIRFAKAGPIYDQKGQYDKAHEMYQKALQIRPGDTNTLYNRGTVYYKQGDLGMAATYFERAVHICSYHVDAMFNLATVYAETGRKKEALTLFQKVLTFQPDSLDVHFQLAKLYADSGNCREALSHADFIISQAPALTKDLQLPLKQCLSH